MNYTLSEQYGTKTIYFEFKTADGLVYKLSDSINYQNATLDNMLSYGILDAEKAADSDILNINKTDSYNFYIKANSSALNGNVVFLDENSNEITREALKCTVTKDGVSTYSKWISLENYPQTKKAVFYLSDVIDKTRESAREELSIDVIYTVVIKDADTKFNTIYTGEKLYNTKGSKANFTLYGTIKECTAKAILKYQDIYSDNELEYEYILPYNSNKQRYEVSADLPANIKKVISVNYILTSNNSSTSTKNLLKTYSLDLFGEVRIFDINNSDGKFNDKYIQLTGQNIYYRQKIKDNQTFIDFKNLPPGEYKYSISDNNLVYADGTVTATSGVTNNVGVFDSKQPIKVKFTTGDSKIDSRSSIYYTYTLNDSNYGGYVELGKEISGFYDGQEITYTLNLSNTDLEKYVVPVSKTIILDTSQTIEIELQELQKITLTGTVSDSYIADRPIDGVNLSFSQYVQNGSTYFYYFTSAVTDENGKYSVELYPNTSVAYELSKEQYRRIYDTSVFSQNSSFDISMDYDETNTIRLDLFSIENVKKGEAPGEPVPMDIEALKSFSLYDSKNNYIYAYRDMGKSALKIYSYVKPGETLKLIPEFNDNNAALEDSYFVTLDDYCNANLKITTTGYESFSANVQEPENADTNLLYYMLVYDTETRKLLGVDKSDTRLTNDNCDMKGVNQCTVIFIKGSNLSQIIPCLTTLEYFNNLCLVEGSEYIKHEITLQSGIYEDLGDITVPNRISTYTIPFSVRYETNFYRTNRQLYYRAFINPINTTGNSSINIEKVEIILPDGCTKKTGYFNKYSNSYGAYYSYFNVGNSDTTKIDLEVTYTVDGNEYTRIFTTNANTEYITMNVPNQVIRGMSAQKVNVLGNTKNDSVIEIYDDNTLVGTAVADSRGNYSATVALTNADECYLHRLRAKVVLDNDEIYSQYQICNVIDADKTAYVSNFKFRNINPNYDPDSTQKFEVNGPSDSNSSIVSAYYPSASSEVSFRINNLLMDDLDEVQVINTYNGIDNAFTAEWVKDVSENGECYSEWYYQGRFGYLGELSVFYSLKNLDELAKVTGEQLLDFERAASTDVDPSKLPKAVRDNIETLVFTEQTDDKISGSINLPGGQSNFSISYDGTPQNINPNDLLAQGFNKYATKQGTYYVKESFNDTQNGDIVNAQMTRTMYFDAALTDILKGSISEQAGIVNSKVTEFASLNPYAAFDSILVNDDSAAQSYAVSAGEAVDTTMTVVNVEGNVQTTVEVIYETQKGKALELGKFGTGMQIIGGVALAVDIFKGASTKDSRPLYDAAFLIKDTNKREQIFGEIESYSKVTRRTYMKKVLFSAVNYGTGFGGPAAKVVGVIAGVGGGYFISAAESEHDAEWNSIMRSILAVIELEEYKDKKKDEKEKKDKKKYGKKEKIIKPKWSIDPSGYVFEAIDSQRIEGITASAFYDDAFDNSTFWSDAEEYKEVNPDTTDVDGRYGWNVPEGVWKVEFEGNGYKDSETKKMTVPPVHDQVNIGLLSEKVPTVKEAVINPAGVEIEFDMFMQAESIYNAAYDLSSINIFDSRNMLVPCKKIEFIVSAPNTAYIDGSDYQKDIIDSKLFVKRVRFVADEDKYIGGFKEFQDDGVTKEVYTVVISKNALSYAGVNIADDCIISDISLTERSILSKPVADKAAGDYTDSSISVNLTSSENATIYYTTDGTTPTALSRVYSGPIIIVESMTIKCIASKAGCDDSPAAEFTYNIVEKPAPADPDDPVSPPSDPVYPPYTPPTPATPGGTGGTGSSGSTDDDKKVKDYNNQFTDISVSSWYYESVKFVYERGLFSGISDTEFGPNDKMNRAMLVTVLHRLAGLPDANENDFTDVKDGQWYTNAVSWASENNIVNGVGDKLFAPLNNITREQIALILFKYAKLIGLDVSSEGDTNKFTDCANISSWSFEAVRWAVGAGIIGGNDDGSLNPGGDATRAEVATMLIRFIKLIEQK